MRVNVHDKHWVIIAPFRVFTSGGHHITSPLSQVLLWTILVQEDPALNRLVVRCYMFLSSHEFCTLLLWFPCRRSNFCVELFNLLCVDARVRTHDLEDNKPRMYLSVSPM